ncbi:MAG: hypothetical protein OXG99_03565 [Alphaproteobacteria bacterium]|nr:hypothetical protein [Alphaproteobacteria bacterium]
MSANRHRTGQPTTAKADMAAYDALSPGLRAALNDAPENLSAEAVLVAVEEDGLAETEALALLAAREDGRR